MSRLVLALLLLTSCRVASEASAADATFVPCANFVLANWHQTVCKSVEKGGAYACPEPDGNEIIQLPPGWQPFSRDATGIWACRTK